MFILIVFRFIAIPEMLSMEIANRHNDNVFVFFETNMTTNSTLPLHF